jgi:anti-sigma B factor antagonist
MVNFEKRDNVEVVTFTVNKINALIADDIRDQIVKVFENANAKLVIDLKGVEYIDSSGFGCFLSSFKAARNNYGTLKFANPEPSVKVLFETLKLNTIFELFDDTDTCLRSFR